MEEEDDAWRDISLSSLSHTTVAAVHNRPLRELDFQDFFTRPSNKDPPTTDSFFQPHSGGGLLFPPPTTILSLSSASSSDQIHGRPSPETTSLSKCTVLPCSNALLPPVGKRRTVKDDGSSSDGDRLKRLMKNRESGDRSRARKQEYLEKLEREFQHLKKQNARLRKQLEKWGEAVEASCDNYQLLLPKKPSLRRTLTSPF